MIDAAQAYLLQGSSIWLNRVVSADATYGLGLISNNWINGLPAGTSFTTIPAGSQVGFEDVNYDIHDITFSGPLVAGTSVTVTINTNSAGAVVYANSSNQTMLALRQAIQTVLNNLGEGGYCDLPVTGNNYQILRLISPPAVTLVVTAVVTGSGAPTATVDEADWLGVVVANNPGSWSCPNNTSGTSGVAVGITNVNTGINQRITVSLSSALLTGQTLSMTVNGITVSQLYTTSNNNTLTLFCNAFNAESAFLGSTSAPIVSGSSNNLQFVLVAPNSNTQLTVTNVTVTGSGSLPLVTFITSLNGTPSTGAFNLVVYENPYFTAPDEIYLCTYENGTDGLGNPTGLSYVINGIPGATGNASPRINIVVNPNFSGTVNGPTGVTNSVNTLGLPNERWLGGGLDGSIPSTQQVVTGWTEFNNPESITIRMLIQAGYTDPAVTQEMISICSSRMDCFSICDVPSASQDVTDAVNFRNNTMDVDSYWGAVYSPDILIYDANMGVQRYVPPSGIMAGQYAYTDKVGILGNDPAGLNRGVINQALGLRYIYEEGDRDNLSSAQINAIRKYGAAWVIWGAYTLQQAMSALQSIGVVRMLITVMSEAASVVAYSIFEPNNPFTWNKIVSALNSLLGPLKQVGSINDFQIECDANNNPPAIIDERVCYVAMYIKPALSILYLQLDGVITTQSAVFSVLEEQVGYSY